MTESTISVIIPVYNGDKYLAQAFESVFKQDYRQFEITVVDDGSSDNTAQIVRRYDDIKYIYKTNEGVASARNTGIAASNGEIIVFLDSDDFWPPNRLKVTAAYFQKHLEVGYVLGKQIMFVEPGCKAPPWLKSEWLQKPQAASNSGVLAVRRTTFDRVGLFNNSIGGEDTEWLVRANEAGVPMARLPEVVLYRRIHGENLSIQMFRARKANLMRIARESIHRTTKTGVMNREDKIPLVSVIISVYNGGAHPAETIDSDSRDRDNR
jgi:glycosyltransferase involved in cell wall biosynthesis